MKVTAIRCYCGKVHTAAFITVTTRCSCDRLLWPQLHAPAPTSATVR